MSSDDEVQVVVPWDAPPSSMQPPALLPAIAVDSRRQPSIATNRDDEVQVVVPWDAQLKLSPIYVSAFDIFSGKGHKSPPLDTKRDMLLNIVACIETDCLLRVPLPPPHVLLLLLLQLLLSL
jgi:hypothetical protein